MDLDYSKLIAGIGLALDLIGVMILLRIEMINRKGDILIEKSLEKQDFVDMFEAELADKKLSKTIEDIQVEMLEQKLSLVKAQKKSKYALGLLIVGFLLQIVSLFF